MDIPDGSVGCSAIALLEYVFQAYSSTLLAKYDVVSHHEIIAIGSAILVQEYTGISFLFRKL